VAKDGSGALIAAEVMDPDPHTGEPLDYIAFGHSLETQIRQKFEDKDVEIQIIGFAKEVSDIADGAQGVLVFCGIALVLTILAVYWYCRSWTLTFQKIICSRQRGAASAACSFPACWPWPPPWSASSPWCWCRSR